MKDYKFSAFVLLILEEAEVIANKDTDSSGYIQVKHLKQAINRIQCGE